MFDSVRGEDGTGIAVVKRNLDDVVVAKEVGNPFNLFETHRFGKATSGLNSVMIGHNRYATQGGINRRNAHPFEFDTLVGAHNGTLSSKYKLDDARDFQVDSENLFHHIEKNGIEDAINQLGGTGNAWALVWWDKLEKSLNFLRNDQRPFFMCRTADEKVLFWASEAWMLEIALARADIKRGEIFMSEVDVHYSVVIDKQGGMEKPVARRVEAPKFMGAGSTTGSSTANSKPALTVVKGEESKKPSPQQTVPQFDASYMGVKQRQFEILSIREDEAGAEYLVLFDNLKPYYEVRAYIRPKDVELRKHAEVGGEILGNITSYSSKGNGFYKVSPWTITMIEEAPKLELYMDHHGKYHTKEEWEKLYASCNWCMSPLVAEDHNRLTTSGDCFCPDCATNKDVTGFVKFMKG